MALKFWNIGKANSEITTAEDVLAPALTKAGISTVTIDGKPVAIADASLAAKISALIAANPPGAGSQQVSDVLVSNDLISKELEKTKTDLAIAQTSVATLTREKADLESKLTVSNKSVETLTAERGDLLNRKQAAENQFTANQQEITAFNGQLSELCLATGVLHLRTAAGEELPENATRDEKMQAADRIAWREKLTAYRGAVNAAIKKTGASPLEIPALPPGGKVEKVELKGRERMKSAMKIEGFNFRKN
jgi:septal ring factor EnvC (AmiA/AmiB activator)